MSTLEKKEEIIDNSNPLYIPAGGSLIANEYGVINNYNELYLLIRKKNISMDRYISIFKDEESNPFRNNKNILFECFELIKIKHSTTKIKHIKNSLTIVDGKDLQLFNEDMSNENYLICIELYLDKDTLLSYIENFERKSLSEYIKLRLVGKYLNDITHISQFIDMMKNVKEFSSWTNYYFLKYNENNNFRNKKFNLENTNIVINDTYETSLTVNKAMRYQEHYETDLTVKELYSFYNLLSKIEKQYFLHYLMCSRDLCHLILDDLFISEISSEHIYSLSYTILSLYQRECNINYNKDPNIKKSSLKTLTLEQCNLLPLDLELYKIYPFNHKLISTKIRWKPLFKTPINGGLVSINTFRERLNIYCTGDKKIDLFKNMDWSNIAITGSFMASALPKHNNLMDKYKNYNEFINATYQDADLDIISYFKTYTEFLDKVNLIKKTMEENLNAKIKKDIIQVIPIYINKHMLKELNLEANKDNPELIIFLHNCIIDNLREKRNKISASDILKYYEIYKYPSEFCFNIYFRDEIDIKEDDLEKNNVTGNKNWRYHKIGDKILFKSLINFRIRLSSPLLKREIEIFTVNMNKNNNDDNAINNITLRVNEFHLGCVRAFYDGTTCHLSPSSYISLTTFVCHDYRYVHGSKNMIDIILKYIKRGFNYMFNINEYNLLIQYGLKNYLLFGYNSEEEFKNNITSLQELNYNHPIFKSNNSSDIDIMKYIYTDTNNKHNIISENGSILKLKSYYIDEIIDTINNKDDSEVETDI